MRKPIPKRRGFTLVELLVVIGIIALLISILLPALQKARKQANTIKCAANLRSIVQAMRIYGAQNNDYIPGSAWSSGAFLFGSGGTTAAIDPQTGLTYWEGDCPGIITPNDWESPVAQAMGINELPSDSGYVPGGTPHFNSGADKASRLSRFEFLRTFQAFQCPENQGIAIPYSGSTLQCSLNVNVAYFQAFEFLLENCPTATQTSLKVNKTGTSSTSSVSTSGFTMTTAVGAAGKSSSLVLPGGWVPKFGRVQNAVRKIALADGARYNDPSVKPPGGIPDIDLNIWDSGGSNYGDSGSFTQSTHSWVRDTPDNPNGETGNFIAKTDYRLLAYRHGDFRPGVKTGQLYMNVAFYDGHVETLDDLASADPAMWLPTGSILNNAQGFFGTPWTDVAALYNVPPASPYIAP